MSGFITKVELRKHREEIVRAYGQDFFEACMQAEGETFLGMLVKHNKI